MKMYFPRHLCALLLWVGCYCCLLTPAQSGILRTQTISLHKGWNAVFLEVVPRETEPQIVFANLPISVVAAYFPAGTPVQFIRDPASIGWKKEGWSVWYAPHRNDAFLSNLHAVDGNRAYLIQAEKDVTWQLEGFVAFEPAVWQSDSFNLLGFGVDDRSPPSFGKFFAPSKAHQPQRVYQLINDQWTLVTNPDASPMKSGEAYWIYCRGGSDYQGPLNVRLDSGRQVLLQTGVSKILLGNRSTDPVRIQTTLNDAELPLNYVVQGISATQFGRLSLNLPRVHNLPVLEAGERVAFKMESQREKMTTPVHSTLLQVSTDSGVRLWIPVVAYREDLTTTP